MSDLLRDNLVYLMNTKPDLFNKIQNFINNSNNSKQCKLIWERNNPNLSYVMNDKEYKLYDLNSQQIKLWSEQFSYIENGKHDLAIVGFGLGHHLVELIKKNNENSYFILEPSIDIFIEALKVINISALLEHPQIKYFDIGDTEEDMHNFIYLKNLYKKEKSITTYIPYYGTLESKLLNRVFELDYDLLLTDLSADSFEVRFQALPYINVIRNIEYMMKSSSLQLIKGRFNGCTAVVVGGGPSLEKDIETIKKYRDSVLVIAAGSTVQSLLYFGIIPHFIVSMDPSEVNAEVFKKVNTSEIPLVFVGQLNYEILEMHPDNNFHCHFTTEQITKFVFRDIELNPVFIPNPSVSGTAIQVASYVGASRILLAGQDFSFPNNQYYSAGVNHHTAEKISDMLNQSHMEVENVKGSKNQTNFSMQFTLENIESLIESQVNDVEIINCSSLGANIKGAPFMPMQEALRGVAKNQYDFKLIQKILGEPIINNFSLEYTQFALSRIIEELDFLIVQCEKSLDIINKIDTICRKQGNKAMSMLVELEKEYSIVTTHGVFQNFIETWNRTLTRQYDKRVIEIEKEKTIVGKSRLINEIVKPYIVAITKSFTDIKEEFSSLNKKLFN